ncbi:MAG: hypothetical protein QOI66_4984 [Myxococcales bacterium]|nr:hypothetical protein [Myxococcales bacterium]
MRIARRSSESGWILVAALALSWSGAALAAKGKVGIRFSGAEAGPTRDAIAQVLEQHEFTVISQEKLEAAATKMHRGLESPGDLVAVAAKLKLVGVVAGEVKDGGHKAGAVVRSGSSGKVSAKATWSASGPKKLADAVKASAWARLGPGLRSGAGGGAGGGGAQDAAAEKLLAAAEKEDDDEDDKPAPAPKAAREEGSREKPAPAKRGGRSDADLEEAAGISPAAAERRSTEHPRSKKTAKVSTDEEGVVVARPSREGKSDGARGLTALELGAGPRFLWRDLHYSGTTGSMLVPFSMAGAPMLGVSALWFPGAHATTGGGANIGIVGSAEYGSGIKSKASDGSIFPTATTDYFGGLRLRLHDGPVELGLTGGYGRHAFVFHGGMGTDRNNINVPDVDNRYLRGAAEVRLALGRDLSFRAGGGYRRVLTAGDARYQLRSAQYFPHATVWGVDATVSLAYRVLSAMEVEVGYDLRRYSYTTNASPSDPIALPNFIDKYSAFWVNLAIIVDGPAPRAKKGSAPREEDDEES